MENLWYLDREALTEQVYSSIKIISKSQLLKGQSPNIKIVMGIEVYKSFVSNFPIDALPLNKIGGFPLEIEETHIHRLEIKENIQ